MTKPPFDAKELTVGQVAARSGVAVTALHFYEEKGLISSRRTAGNQRRYPRDTLRRISFVRVAQRVGIPLRMVAEALAELPEGRTPTREDWARLSESWRAALDDRIDQLLRLRDTLSDCIGCGCLSIDRCVLRNPDDRLGDEGAGPRRLLTARAAEQSRSGGPDPRRPDRRSVAGPPSSAGDHPA
ncbi:redox-sensitive transcriptional activator SoxR [Sphaerisporangium rufum]|uniref:Redox-sensitive transcriptional activator SoxR n=1 Tax=Sphaerisporangium rufum TaxID=1381558 RepID=A0A919UYW1_9ACTN|nr:redox-sensitive transcriptional activator SoxR [Sphaerisporangium rufum]GII77174.1 redox-sensitive transcriptional activator SoxR [Sphaerisporangium rufum]